MAERILIADDETVLRRNLAEYLGHQGFEVLQASDGLEALELLRTREVGVLISDIRMPRMDGLALLERAAAEVPETHVLLITAFASVDTAVGALRSGAYDYLLKPVVFEDLLQKVQNIFSYRALAAEVRYLRRRLQGRPSEHGIVGSGPSIEGVRELIRRVAPTSATVLITGESGTGKELVARAVHEQSERAERLFLPVNVAAIPADLLEAQLFGHVRGAFTGATQRREGVFRAARGGTVFLDEIGELPPGAQAKLLRALEGHEVLPVGADRPEIVDFRLVAATNRDLEERVAAGSFRDDLFYRLNVFRVQIPPLRERREDIPALAEHLLERHRASLGRPASQVSNAAMRWLCSYRWRGNVRELSNVLERALILAADGRVDVEHLPAELLDQAPLPTTLREAVEEAERKHIDWVLRSVDGSREEAARVLDIDRATLYRRLDRYGLGQVR